MGTADELLGGLGVLWISSDGDDWMGAKVNPQKILEPKNYLQENPMPNFLRIKRYGDSHMTVTGKLVGKLNLNP